MKYINYLLFFILCSFSFYANSVKQDWKALKKIYSPEIKENTLIIKGRIDSHIYDFFSYNHSQLDTVKYISLNSYGGKLEWTLEIAKKIKKLNIITRLEQGNVCASSCVYLFAAGKERFMEENTWLGFHGPHIGGGQAIKFSNNCLIRTQADITLKENDTYCAELITQGLEFVHELTDKSFDFLESNGVDKALREYYLSLEDEEDWYKKLNLLKKPNLIIDQEMALEFNLATPHN